jgi:quinol-cytochrome oxidoreductase complex cytochrome b subunit
MSENEKYETSNEIIKIMNDPQPFPRKVPDYMRGKGGLWYWTGAILMFAFLYEAVTGLILLFAYIPSAAYSSTEYFLNSTPYGMIILTTHLYGAYVMIAVLYLHLLRNLFVGAYKKPRQNQWFLGVLLLLMTIGVGFFGYSMSGDVLSINATGVGKGIAADVPYMGDYLKRIFFGNGTTTSLFQRMLGWHVVLVVLIGVLFALHFFLAEYNTIMPKRSEANYTAPAVDKESSAYKAWFPYNMLYMVQIALYTFALILIIPSFLAALPNSDVPMLFSPFPQVAANAPFGGPFYPPWFLLFVYKAMDFDLPLNPLWMTVVFGGIPVLYVFFLPWIDRNKSLSILDRPITVSLSVVGTVYLILMSVWGGVAAGQPISAAIVAAFFLGIGIPVFIVVWLAIWSIKNDKVNLSEPGKSYLLLALTGIFAFATGSFIIPSIESGASIYTIPLIFFASITAYLVFMDFIIIRPKGVELTLFNDDRKFRPFTYTIISAILVFAAVAILTIISFLDPTNVAQESGYGLGLGLLLFISGTLIKIYRTTEYAE